MPDRATEGLLRYAWGLDLKDADLVGSCFTDDVVAEYAGEQLAPCRDAILTYTGQRTEDDVLATTHAISNVAIRFRRYRLGPATRDPVRRRVVDRPPAAGAAMGDDNRRDKHAEQNDGPPRPPGSPVGGLTAFDPGRNCY